VDEAPATSLPPVKHFRSKRIFSDFGVFSTKSGIARQSRSLESVRRPVKDNPEWRLQYGGKYSQCEATPVKKGSRRLPVLKIT
jgi:hypothetical protein